MTDGTTHHEVSNGDSTYLTDEVIEFLAQRLALFEGRTEVRQYLKEINGGKPVSRVSVRLAMAAAQKYNLERMQSIMSKEGQVERAMALYVECMKDPKASWRDRMHALDGYNQLLELAKYKPRTTESLNALETAEKLRDILGEMHSTVQ